VDWTRAIEKYRDDLLAIVTTLFVLAGIRAGRVVAALPRYLRLRVAAAVAALSFRPEKC
jgi:hypothetical protein